MPRKTKPKLRKRGRPAKATSTRKPHTKVTAELHPDELLFAESYVCRFNATRAYLDTHPDVLPSTARTEGSRWLHKPNIASYIKGLVAELKRSLRSSSARVLEETAALAFSNLADVFDQRGLIIPPAKLPRNVALALKEVKRQEILGADADGPKVLGHTVEIKMHDKLGSLKLLGQHYGIFKEQIEVSGKDLAALLKEGRERAPA